MKEKNTEQSKNANNKVDVVYKIWLGRMFWNITFIPLSNEDVEAIQDLLVCL